MSRAVAPYLIKKTVNSWSILDKEVDHVKFASSKKTMNQVLQLTTPSDTYILKIYQNDPQGYMEIDISRLAHSLNFQNFLSERFDYINKPLSNVLDTEYGPAILWTFIPDFDENKMTWDQNHLTQLAQTMAKLHQEATNFTTSYSEDQLYFCDLPTIIKNIAEGNQYGLFSNLSDKSWQHVRDLANRWVCEFETIDTWVEPVWLHGDLHPDNICIGENGNISHIIDWDRIKFMSPVVELVQSLRKISIHNPDMVVPFWQEYISVYGDIDKSLIELIIKGNQIRTSILVTAGGLVSDKLAGLDYSKFLEYNDYVKKLPQMS